MAILCDGPAASAQGVYPSEPPPGYGPSPGYRPGYHGYYEGRRIVPAVYGTRGRYVDVTRMVRHFAREGIPFEVSNETFGVDPYKGKGKHLRVVMVRPADCQTGAGPELSPGLLRYATARPRLAASIVG
jgi:hypothetical protein